MSRTTIEVVYEQLASEGLIVRGVGRGSFVADVRPALRPASVPPSTVAVSARGSRLSADKRCREPLEIVPFNAGVPDARLFPVDSWERCRRRALNDAGPMLLNSCDTRGLQPLREQLSRYLAQFRGVRATPDEVLIFESTSQALTALFLLLADPGEQVLVEDPGYPAASAAAQLADLTVVPVPVDGAGLDIEAGQRTAPDARLAYVTPAHQYPTGVTMTQLRRQALLAWAAERDGVVIEDDYDADFRYHGEPLTTLRALDGGARVIYLGTLSKAMFLGLRLAYAVVPAPLVEPLTNLKAQLAGFPPIATQATLSRFIEQGYLAAHMRAMRRVYAEKLSWLVEALKPMLTTGWESGPATAGLHFILYEPAPGIAARVAAASGLSLDTLSHYARLPLARDGLSLRFGGLTRNQIEQGAAALCAVSDMIRNEATSGSVGLSP